MKRIIALTSALMLLICAVSCSGNKDITSDTESLVENEVSLLSFKSADIRMADDFSEILCTDKKMTNYLIFGKLQSGEYSGYITNNEFAEKKSFIFTPQEDETVKSAGLMKFGKSAVLTTLDENTFIYTFDSNGNLENTFNIGEVLTPNDHFAELLCTADGFYINIDRYALAYIDKDGNYKGEINASGRTVCGLVNDNNDVPCVLMSQNGKMTLGTLNADSITEKIECGELADYTNSICTGMGDYRIAVVVSSGLYGLKGDKWVKLTDFSDNDFNTQNVFDIDMTAENEFTALVSKDGINFGIRLLSQRDISEIKQKNIIKLADVAISEYDPYNDLIKKYNSESENNKIEIVQYRSEFYEDAIRSLDLDIVAGNAPDIIIFNSYAPIETFGNKESIFVDMYELMDKDSDIDRTDFLDGFLESLETNGKLLQITQSFNVESYMIKDKFADGLTSWNIEELESIYKKYSDNMNFSVSSQYKQMEYILDELIVCSRFYDRDNAECSFDSPEFINAMKFIKNNNIGISANDASYIENYGGANAEISAFRNDEVLLQRTNIMGFSYLRQYQQVYSDENVTFIGFPSDDNVTAISMPLGTYGIMESSQNIDGAWDFLKYYLLSDDSFNDSFNQWMFSGIEKNYKNQLDYHCTPHTYTDSETGEEKNADIYTYFPENSHEPVTIELQPFTDEETKKYDSFVRTALKNSVDSDVTIYDIVAEETAAYFAGERSAEEAAEIIQNRVSIYLSEQS